VEWDEDLFLAGGSVVQLDVSSHVLFCNRIVGTSEARAATEKRRLQVSGYNYYNYNYNYNYNAGQTIRDRFETGEYRDGAISSR